MKIKTLAILFISISFAPIAMAQNISFATVAPQDLEKQGYKMSRYSDRTFVWAKESSTTQLYPGKPTTVFKSSDCIITRSEQIEVKDINIFTSTPHPIKAIEILRVKGKEIQISDTQVDGFYSTFGKRPDDLSIAMIWTLVGDISPYIVGKTGKSTYRVYFKNTVVAEKLATDTEGENPEFIKLLASQNCPIHSLSNDSSKSSASPPTAVSDPNDPGAWR